MHHSMCHNASQLETNQQNTRKGKQETSIIKGYNIEEQIKKWYNHFQKLIGWELNETVKSGNCEVLPIFNYLNIPTDSSSKDEYEVAKKKKLVDSKAAGPDGIPLEVFKYCNCVNTIQDYTKNILNNSQLTT